MAVDAEGDRDCGVAEAFLDDSWVDALLQGECGPGVAEAVERKTREVVAYDSSKELGAHGVGPET